MHAVCGSITPQKNKPDDLRTTCETSISRLEWYLTEKNHGHSHTDHVHTYIYPSRIILQICMLWGAILLLNIRFQYIYTNNKPCLLYYLLFTPMLLIRDIFL